MKFEITPVKTYATEKNAEAAVIKLRNSIRKI